MVNARIRTGVAHRPWADALAVAGDRIVAVGSSAEIRKLAGPLARVVNARSFSIVPGTAARWKEAGRGLRGAGTDATESGLAPGMVADFLLVDSAVPDDPDVTLAVEGGRIVHESHTAQGDPV